MTSANIADFRISLVLLLNVITSSVRNGLFSDRFGFLRWISERLALRWQCILLGAVRRIRVLGAGSIATISAAGRAAAAATAAMAAIRIACTATTTTTADCRTRTAAALLA